MGLWGWSTENPRGPLLFPPPIPLTPPTPFPEQEPRQAHAGTGDSVFSLFGDWETDCNLMKGTEIPVARREGCFPLSGERSAGTGHRASALGETGRSGGLSSSGSGFSGARGPRRLCAHGLLSPSDHRHLWEEPDPFRSRLHYQVPGPVHQLHLHLQHSHEGEGVGGHGGACHGEAPHTMRLRWGTQAVEPGGPGFSPV